MESVTKTKNSFNFYFSTSMYNKINSLRAFDADEGPGQLGWSLPFESRHSSAEEKTPVVITVSLGNTPVYGLWL